MKYCSQCGAAYEDNQTVCPSCGAAESQPQTAPAGTGTQPSSAPSDKKNLKVIICAVAIVVVIALIVILCVACGGGSGYKSAVKNYEKMLNGNFDEKLLGKLAPEDYWDEYEENTGDDIGDVADDLKDYFDDSSLYGIDQKDIQMSVSVKKAHKLNKELLDDLKDVIHDHEDSIKKSSIKAATRLSILTTYKFDLEDVDNDELLSATARMEDGVTGTIYAVKIDKKWYLFTSYGSLAIKTFMPYSY